MCFPDLIFPLDEKNNLFSQLQKLSITFLFLLHSDPKESRSLFSLTNYLLLHQLDSESRLVVLVLICWSYCL